MHFLKNCPLLCLVVILAFADSIEGLRLNQNGGYDLSIAISSPDPGQNEALLYIQNLKFSMQTFSNQLWKATRRRFHINAVEVILPGDWEVPSADIDTAQIGGINNADFRISNEIFYPHANNPNLCGLPGNYLEFPYSFFNSTNSNEYGLIWKSLMVLFARYRFGAWEEHGFIGDEKFPYFYRDDSEWKVTGCNNAQLSGDYRNAETNEECSYNWTITQEEINKCRFVPNRANTAKTSLMHFHWMDSVEEFCDDATHNALAHNKHNTFCDGKSVMQVIRDSPDYHSVLNPRNDVPELDFKTVKQSRKPLLYILIDRGEIQGSQSLANMIPPALSAFIQRNHVKDAIGAVGSYPNPNSGIFHVNQEVDWFHIANNLEKFLGAIGTIRLDGPMERDFSKAIMEVVGKIKARNHPQGATILVLKFGADLENLKKTLSESEVIVALSEQKIILHSIELGITNETLISHLSQVASATRGTYTVLSTLGESLNAINNVLNYAAKPFDETFLNDLETWRTVKNADISAEPNGEHLVALPPQFNNLEVFYSSFERLTASNFSVKIGSNDATTYSFRRTIDWNVYEGGAKYSYKFRFSSEIIGGAKDVTVSCTNSECNGTMIIARVEINETSADVEKVRTEVTVSSTELDLVNGGPLKIFAKATLRDTPIAGLVVDAYISNGSSTHWLELHDDGNIPDVLEKDGIFSAYFVPQEDGEYRISVEFKKVSESGRRLRAKTNNRLIESSLGRLLPIDQGSSAGSCEVFNNCTLETVTDGFVQTETLEFPIAFKNVAEFKPKPAKSLLTYFFGRLHWISPRVPGVLNVKAESYEVKWADSREELLKWDSCDTCSEETISDTRSPGLAEQFAVTTSMKYYAIKSVYNGQKSEISNIVLAGSGIPQDPSTTPTTTGPVIPSSSTETSVTPSSSTETSVTPSSSTETPVIPSSSTETPATPSSSTETPVIPSSSTETPVIPSSSTETSVTPSSSTETPVTPSSSTETPVIPSSSTETPVTSSSSTETPATPSSSTETPVIPSSSTETTVIPSSSTSLSPSLSTSSSTGTPVRPSSTPAPTDPTGVPSITPPSMKVDKPWVETAAGIGTIVGIVVVIILIAGGAAILCRRNRKIGSVRISI